MKLVSIGYLEGFYYRPRMDFENLKKLWSNDDLVLAVPFYDSFIYKNLLTYNACVPDFSFTEPVFFTENNSLPFDNLIKEYKNKIHLKTKVVYNVMYYVLRIVFG